MFHGVIVDGISSCIPGGDDEYGDGNGDEDMDPDTPLNSHTSDDPNSSGSRKRSNSTMDTHSSPRKKAKSPMMKVLQGLVDTVHQIGKRQEEINLKKLEERRLEREQKEREQKEKEEHKERAKREEQHEINNCLRMAIECGATEDSDEYFVATKLFAAKFNRDIFCNNFQTKEGKLGWLRRNYQHLSG